MAGTDPRFGLIPLPLSQSGRAVANEFLLDPNTGHIYIKKADGTLLSKTVELENRINAILKRAELVEDTIVIPGSRFDEATSDKHITLASDGFTFKSVSAVNLNLFKMSYSKFFKYLVAIEYTDSAKSVPTVKLNTQSVTGSSGSSIAASVINKTIDSTTRMLEYECLPSGNYADNGICFVSITPANTTIKIKSVTVKKIPLLLHEDIGFKQRIDRSLLYAGAIGVANVSGDNLKINVSTPLTVATEKLAFNAGMYSITIPVTQSTSSAVQLSVKIGSVTKTIVYSKIPVNAGLRVATIAMPISNADAISELEVSIANGSISGNALIPYIDIELINTSLYDHSYL